MSGSIYSADRDFVTKRKIIKTCAALAIPLLLSLLVLALADKASPAVAVCGALFFCGLAAIFLMGDIVRRFVYCFFLIQFIASYFLLFSWYAAIVSLMVFPLVIAFTAKTNLYELSLPYKKSLFLFLSGWLITFIYMTVTNSGALNFFSMHFDSYFLLGFAVAYQLFFLLKLKLLNPEKLILCLALNGLTVIGFVLADYLLSGNLMSIFNERFGSSTSMNPNIISSYLDLALPCAFFSAFFEKRNFIKKTLLYALAAVYLCAILMAATRASLFGIAVIVAYVVWRKGSKKLQLSLLVCTVLLLLTFGGTVLSRMHSPKVGDVYSDIGRVELLRAAFRVLSENHFVFGIGMNNFCRIKSEYGFPLWFDPVRGMSAHNFFIEVWLGVGILGLLGWLIFNARMVVTLIRKKSDSAAALSVAFAVISFSLHGLFDCAYGYFSLMFIYFSLLGVGLFAVKTDENLKTRVQITPPEKIPRLEKR